MKNHDLIIIGGGISGLRTAISAHDTGARNIAIICKAHPVRSQSAQAQGGIAFSDKTSTQLHIQDTLTGGADLSDKNAVKILAEESKDALYDLEKFGVPFTRSQGKFSTINFGGHTEKRVHYASDKTGHRILHSFFEQVLKRKIKIYDNYFALKLIIKKNICRGAVCYDLKKGRIQTFNSKAIVMATGGYARIFKTSSNSALTTSDGLALVYKEGIPVMDIEFVQFHPTGLKAKGMLISEAARGEGGYIVNTSGKRFIKAENKELATRDILSREISQECKKRNVFLDLRHLSKEKIKKLPQIQSLVQDFAGLDISKDRIPIEPTAHYSMGGIPINTKGEVLVDGEHTPVKGLYAVGECSCVSIHGANRLGSNSLLECVVFGKRVGKSAALFASRSKYPNIPPYFDEEVVKEIEMIMNNSGQNNIYDILDDLQTTMTENCGIIRDEKGLLLALESLRELKKEFDQVFLEDKSLVFNTELLNVLETRNMLNIAEVLVSCALARQESRGSHYRSDFPKKSDDFRKHSIAFKGLGGPIIEYKKVKW